MRASAAYAAEHLNNQHLLFVWVVERGVAALGCSVFGVSLEHRLMHTDTPAWTHVQVCMKCMYIYLRM